MGREGREGRKVEGVAEGVVWGVGGSACSRNRLGGVVKGVDVGVPGGI